VVRKPVERDRLDAYENAVHRAVDWLVGMLNPDGSMNPVEKGALAYYKVPRGLAVAGRLSEANAMLDWAKRELMTDEGDFRAPRAGFHRFHYTYSSAWFVWTGQVLGRFDVSYPGMDYLRRFRHPGTGGYCSEDVFAEGNHNEQDLLTICFTSFIGLYMGMIDEAVGAAALVEGMLDRQPDIRRRLWLRVDGSGELVTGIPGRCGERRFYVLEIDRPGQYYYYPGAALVFLAKLYSITRDRRHLALAERIFDICLRCHEDAFLTDGTGKVGLGSAYLFALTGDDAYAEAALRSCDFLAGDQKAGGFWERGGAPTASSTAEFVVWLSEIVSILSAGA